MQNKQNKHDNQKDKLPAYKSVPLPAADDMNDDSVAAAASELGDVHPVFGYPAEPQKILDKEVIGNEDNLELLDGEAKTTNFDPELDTRIQNQPEE